MDKGMQSLLNVVLSVLAPVMILDHCSGHGDALYEIGPTAAITLALSLPLACGVYSFLRNRTVDPVTFMGLAGTVLTAVVTFYANMGDGVAIRPDTPWWYAAKEALIPLLLGGIMIVSTRSSTSMLRVFIYSDTVFDIPHIEQCITARGAQQEYDRTLFRASLMTASSLFASAFANFLLALHFLLPVLQQDPAEQAVAYNYAVSSMTWYGYLIIGIPLFITLFCVIRYLVSRLERLTGSNHVLIAR